MKAKRDKELNKALEVLQNGSNLRQVYDYDLMKLIKVIETELREREEKRKTMVNSLEDMCDRMIEAEDDECTFYYSPKNPEELMKSDEDEITDGGYDYIRQQIGARGKKIFKRKGRIFEVRAEIGEDNNSYFELEIRQELEEL